MNWFERLARKREMERRLDAELRHHLDSLAAAHMQAGLNEQEARRRARLEFGGLEEVKENCRDARGTVLVESLWQDLKLAFRTLAKSPVFTVSALATLTLGIGANIAVFQLLDAVFLRSLPVQDPQRLVLIEIKGGNGGFGISRDDHRLTWPLFAGVREHQQGLSGVFAWADESLRVGMIPDIANYPGCSLAESSSPRWALRLSRAGF